MSRLSLERREQDLKLRREFELRDDTVALLPCADGFRVDLGLLTYEQADHVLREAQRVGVKLNRRRTR